MLESKANQRSGDKPKSGKPEIDNLEPSKSIRLTEGLRPVSINAEANAAPASAAGMSLFFAFDQANSVGHEPEHTPDGVSLPEHEASGGSSGGISESNNLDAGPQPLSPTIIQESAPHSQVSTDNQRAPAAIDEDVADPDQETAPEIFSGAAVAPDNSAPPPAATEGPASPQDGSADSEDSDPVPVTETTEAQQIPNSEIGQQSDSDSADNTVAENLAAGASVGITALAKDPNETDTVTYSLSDDAGGRFQIDPTTGVVTTTGPLNREEAGSYDIEITATSSDTSTAVKTYTVFIEDTDEFDIGAVSDGDGASNLVSESAANGTAVGVTASASDADATNNTITYSVVDASGDPVVGGPFAVDGSTGVVTVADNSQLDYETATSHTVYIKATSSDGSSSQQSFVINLSDADEFDVGAVSDSDGTSNLVSESAANGTAVGVTASASDADATNNTITYSVVDTSGDPVVGGPFAVDGSTGVVTVADNSQLDYETATSHTVYIKATSSDGSSSQQSFVINLSDADEFDVEAVSDSDGTSNLVSESAANGTAVGVTASASDADATNNTITYSVVDASGDPIVGGPFAVESSSGVVTVADNTQLDYETATSHTVYIKATSSDGSSSQQSFVINLSDADEFDVGAVSDSDGTSNLVSESAANGTAVGVTASASDADATNNTITYSVVNASGDPVVGGPFAVDSSSGVVTVADNSQLDYETATSHTVYIKATSSDGSSSQQSFVINLSDADEFDVGAVSDSDGTSNLVSESAANGTAVGVTASASDADATNNAITYSVVDASGDPVVGGPFAVDGSTGVVTVADNSQLDYETATSHRVYIKATSSDGSSSQQSFVINLSDADEFDVGAVSDSDGTSNLVPESAANGTAVGVTASASDADATNNTITYSVVDASGDPVVGGPFAVDGSSGVVTVADNSQLDYETATSHTVYIKATSSDGSSSQQSFVINLSDADEFDVGAVSDSDGTSNLVSESAANGTAVGVTASASDADATNNTITYSVVDASGDPVFGGPFTVDGSSGVITVADNSQLDYETATSHTVYIKATSSDGSSSQQSFIINLSDADEFDVGAVSDSDGTSNLVSEAATNGTAVGVTASASDADATNNTITYSVVDASGDPVVGGPFAVDSSSGVVTVADNSQLDYETATSHTVYIKATSTDGSSSQQSFVINLSDAGEFDVGAVTDSDGTTNLVSESAANGTNVGITASATDADATNNTITYSVVDASGDPVVGGPFAVDSSSGVVTVADNSQLDYETATSHTIYIKATSSDGSSSQESFVINLSDADEFDVGAVSDSDGTSNLVSESAANGTSVGVTSSASDADATNNTITYSVVDASGDPVVGGPFAVDESSGVVTVADNSQLDYETAASHTVYIKATSSDGSSSQQSFVINLSDADEFDVGAVSDSDGTSNLVSESAANGTAVGVTASASDADATNNTITYSVVDASGDPVVGGPFAVDGSSGVVTVADNSQLDYETATSHTVYIKATSSDGSSSQQSFVINLSDADEFDVGAVSDSDGTSNLVSESAANGTAVGVTASASDADATNNTITYSVVDASGDPVVGGPFAVDGSTGVVTVADNSQLDYETATSHTVYIKATSTDGSSSQQSFVINLSDADEFDVGAVSDSDGTSNLVSESAANGTAVGVTASASDADATNNTITYSVVDASGDPVVGGPFAVDSSSGVVTVADNTQLDYETATSHTVYIKATSSDGSSSQQSFVINLSDADEFDVGAVSDSDGTSNLVSESAANGTAVGVTASASDADATNNTITYSVVDASGDPVVGGPFAVDGLSGVVTVADNSQLDYETATSHTIYIKATSSDGSSSQQSFVINLSDADEFDVGAVSDSDGTSNLVSESAANGTAVGVTASASDADATNNTITYSVVDASGDPVVGGPFAVDGSSGVVTVADDSQLDYETATSHTVYIKATSSDGSSSQQSFVINLSDADEFDVGAVSDSDGTSNLVSESAANGTAVGVTASASDADATNNTITYSVVDASGDPVAGGPFAVDGSSGVVTVADNSRLDYETAASHTVYIKATSSDGSSSQQSFVINLSDADEFDVGAVSDSDGISNLVSESAANGTAVGVTASASDADATNNTITYSIVDASGDPVVGGPFAVDGSSGVVTVADNSQLDYETATSHTIYIKATSSDGSSSQQSFVINLSDADEFDVGAVSDSDGASNLVSESAANGTAVGITASASDADATNNTITYSIVDASGDPVVGGPFAVDGSSGVVTVADNSQLDYETATSHTVYIKATSSDGSSSQESFVINLSDADEFDVGSVGDSDGTSNLVSESAANGTAVGVTASASDADATNNAVTYSVVDASGDPVVGGPFAVDSSSGVVTVADNSQLDYETATSHTVYIKATSSDGSSSQQSFVINLTDADEFDVGAVSDSDGTSNLVSESAANGTAVGVTASASDADATNNTITYSVVDASGDPVVGGPFAVDGSSGVVTVADNSQLDYETATSHTIYIKATSSDGSSSQQSFVIDLSDADEFDVGAVSDSDGTSNLVSESAANGTAVGVTASASDADATNNTITYSVVDASGDPVVGGPFTVDGSSGVITVADNSQLDYETATSHTVYIKATSSDGSSSQQSFVINLSDADEFDVGAVSDSDGTSNLVSEAATNGTAVGVTASASDADATNNAITYSVVDASGDPVVGGPFAVDSSSGVVTVADNSQLDYETATSHTVYIKATSSDGSSSQQSFVINLSDADEFDVGAVSDSDGTSNLVSESATNGTAVGVTASASDADATDNTITYSVVDASGDPVVGGPFAVDSSSGIVTVADNSQLDYETATSHTVYIKATSSDGSSSQQSFVINLSDADEFDVGAVSDSDGTSNLVSESAANGTAVGVTASASDADATNNTITYSVVDASGDPVFGGPFAVDSSSGVVTVADNSQLDYETATSHTVYIKATSSDGSSSQQSFTINLSDADEFDVGAVSDSDGASNLVSESAANGTAVGVTASASDADATNNTITYSVVDASGDPVVGGPFAVDSSSGVVTVADNSQLDYETATSHTVYIKATSSDGSSSQQSFVINLSDADEFDVGAVSDDDGTSNLVSESAANGTAVGVTASASDADATNNTITYSVVDASGDPVVGGPFAVDSSTGVVTVADNSQLDYETATSHAVYIKATSSDGSSSQQSFVINLSDADEFNVGSVTDSDGTSNLVSESAANGTAVGVTASASDADATNNTITYSVVDASGDPVVGGPFAVDGSTGVVTVADNSQLDYETATSHTVYIKATSSDGSSSQQSFVINLSDADEFDVGAVSDSDGTSNLISESAANGTAVGVTALASDADATNNTITYSVVDASGDPVVGGPFAVDGSSGIVTVADSSQLDYETATSHTVYIKATSSDGSSSQQSFVINLSDADEFDVGAVSDSDGTSNLVSESAANGTAVGVTASASDGDATNNTITYSVVDASGDPVVGGPFAVDSSSGVVTVADNSQLDYETATSHTVYVKATSSDGSSSQQSFVINLSDADEFDVGSVTDSDGTSNLVSESAANGTAVGVTASASDADATNNTITYSVVDASGDPVVGGPFAVDGSSGVVTVADNSQLDYETATSHTVYIKATSSDGSSSQQSFVINLSDADEFDVGAVSDGDGTSNLVSESAANGTAVGVTASASDADATNNTITYSVVDASGDPVVGGPFAVDGSTGVVTVADNSQLDYETATSHTVYIKATSSDGSSSQQSFVINLSDADEFDVGAVSDSDGTSNLVSESAANGTAVGVTALASDADATNNTITYSVVDASGDPVVGGPFAVDGSSGIVTVADSSQLDYETATSHTVYIKATSSDGSSSQQSFVINLSDADEFDVGAVSDSDGTSNLVSESAANGTAVGVTASSSDADATNNTITYSVVDASGDPVAGGPFAVDSSSGVVTVADNSQLDYETATSHTVYIKATSSDGSSSQESFIINLSDADEFDVGAVSDSDGTSNLVSESAANGTAVGVTASASDADATNNTITYSVVDASGNPVVGGPFAVDSSSGVVTVADNSQLDYETATSHTVNIKATSSDGSSSQQSFVINLSDADEFDVGAVSDSDGTSNLVSESAANGTAVGVTASASDADASNNAITYSVVDASGDPVVGGPFAVDSTSGVVTVGDNSQLDYETATSHTVYIKATSSDGSSSQQSFVINLSDADEFDVGTVSDSDGTSNLVSESAANGTTIGVTASASDADATNNTIIYRVVDASGDPVVGGPFAVDSSSGVVTVADNSQLDYETATSHTVYIKATSSDGSSSQQSFVINLSDADEFDVGAVSDSDGTSNLVSESAANGTAVGVTASASDADATNNTITYSVVDASGDPVVGGPFAVDSSSGVVTVADNSQLDYETATTHTVYIKATSSDGSSSQQSFVINLSDADEFDVGAVSDSDGTSNLVSESAANGTAVGVTASASDADATNNTITYSVVDASGDPVVGGPFAVDSSSGVVTVADNSQLDYETATSHTVYIKATSSDGSSSQQSFVINLSDADEFDVGAVSDSDGTSNLVSESAANGTAVGVTASASDADATNNTITYSVVDASGDPVVGGPFTVDGSTGVVTVADNSQLDYETATSHTVYIKATSSDGSSSQQSFVINLSDADEFDVGAVSDSDGTSNLVSESAANGTAVGVTASASDADATNNTITYSVVDASGDPVVGGPFTVDSSSGVVTVADNSQLDYETTTSHTVYIKATSSDGSSSQQSFVINLSDTDEFDVGAVSDSDGTSNMVSESAANGTAVGVTASASDADATNNTITYSVVDASGDPVIGGPFDVDSSSGVVTVADNSQLDYETATSHTVYIKATSSDGSSSQQSFVINLSDANEAPTDLHTTGNANLTPEAQSVLALNDTGETDEYAAASNFQGFPSDTITVEVAFQADDTTSSDFILFSYATSSEFNELVIGQDSSGDLLLLVGGQHRTFNISTDLTDGNPHTVSVSASASTGAVTVYIDGVQSGSTTVTPFGFFYDNGTVMLGQEQDSVGGGFDSSQIFSGEMDFVRIFDDIRTSTEIADNYDQQIADPSSEGGLVSNWQMSELNGSTISDLAGSNDLAINSGPELIQTTTLSAGSVVGSVSSVIDEDAGETFSYALTDDAGGLFQINASGEISLVSEHSVSAELNDTVTVQVTDSGGLTYSEVVSINLGTNAADTIASTSNNDITHGFDGDDTINGGLGDDWLSGGSGTDTIDGGDGNDVIIGGASASRSSSNLISNGSFENPDTTGGFFSSITGWTASSGFVVVLDEASSGQATQSGEQYLYIDDMFGNAHVYQDIQTEAGLTYELNLDIATLTGAPAGSSNVDIYWNGSRVEAIEPGSSDWQTYSFYVTGSGGMDRLELRDPTDPFSDRASDGYGALIDNISLEEVNNLVVNGSFENPDTTNGSFSSIRGWTASNGGIEIIDESIVSESASAGEQFLELDDGWDVDQVYQDIQTEAGASYDLSLDVAHRIGFGGANTSNVDVYWNGTLVENISPSSSDWETFTFRVTGTGGLDRLELREPSSAESEGFGALIDNVMLVEAENLIVNGSFEDTDVTSWDSFSSITGWTASSGGIEVMDETNLPYDASDGEQYLEIDNGMSVDHVYQDVQTQTGKSYTLSLDVSDRPGAPANSSDVDIYWNGTLIESISPASTSWETFTFEVVGTGGLDRLEFREPSAAESDGYGALIDNVSLVASTQDTLIGGDGDDLFIYELGDGNDIVTGGAAGGWTDTIELVDMDGSVTIDGQSVTGQGWTMQLDAGSSIGSQNGESLSLSGDASGTITFSDGATITFTEIETVNW